MRLSRLDVTPREWIPESGWPIPYEELEQYYPRASQILKLPSFDAFEQGVLRQRMSPTERRLFDNADLWPNISMWAKKPLRFGAVYRKQLQKSRNISLYLHANVTDIQLNHAGNRVEECTAMSLSGKTLHLKAKHFVLACGGLETARLLLVSRAYSRRALGISSISLGGTTWIIRGRCLEKSDCPAHKNCHCCWGCPWRMAWHK